MKSNLKTGILSLTIAGLLVGGASIVSAQTSTTNSTNVTATQSARSFGMKMGQMQRGQHGMRAHQGGLDVQRLALGSSVTVSFYDADPAEGAVATSSITHVVGQDSELAFYEELQAARETAAFMTIETSEQTRDIDLSTLPTDDEAHHPRGARAGMFTRGLQDGESVSVEFFTANPEEGGTSIQTLEFVAGVDSERGFSEEVQGALEDAGFVRIVRGAQSRTVDLSQQPERPQFDSEGRPGGMQPMQPRNGAQSRPGMGVR